MVEALLSRVRVRRYLVNGVTHFAIAVEPSLPKAIQPLVESILGLDDSYSEADEPTRKYQQHQRKLPRQ
jgi:hypothetical protein